MNTRGRRFALSALTVAFWTGRPSSARAQASAPSDKGHDDLLGLRAIAVEALQLVRRGDVGQARARVEEMEARWRIQSKLKAVSPAKWKAVDAALDRAERELRFWRVRTSDSATALQTLIETIDSGT